MKKSLKIVILDSSEVIRHGFASVLKREPSFQITVFESGNFADLPHLIDRYQPDILLLNPIGIDLHSLAHLRKDREGYSLKWIALQSVLSDPAIFAGFDEVFSIYDAGDLLRAKLVKLFDCPKNTSPNEVLSQREKEVLVCVVNGMTNKQIAENLCISLHTVITHRRNISAKLDIHSTAGLTIYAIVNNLVDLK